MGQVSKRRESFSVELDITHCLFYSASITDSANQNTDSGRAGAIGIVVMLGNTGGLIACWSYLTKDAPDFLPGNALNVGASCAIVIMVALLTLYLRNENKRREEGKRDNRLDALPLGEQELLGHNHPAFRYRY